MSDSIIQGSTVGIIMLSSIIGKANLNITIGYCRTTGGGGWINASFCIGYLTKIGAAPMVKTVFIADSNI